MGTSGTVTSGNKKRLRVRTFMRINAMTFETGQRVFGSGSFNGTAVMHMRPSDNHFGLSVFGGAITYGSVALTTGMWYQVTLDILLDVSASTQVTATLTVASEDGTSPSSVTVGPTALGTSNDTINVITFGDNGGDHNAPYSVDFDDVVWGATSNADAVGAITLPTQLRIIPILVTGSTRNDWETGSVSNIDEIPLDISGGGLGDTLQSAHAAGTEVDLTHQGTDDTPINIGDIVGLKVYAFTTTNTTTSHVDAIVNGVTKSLVSSSGGYTSGAACIAYQDWATPQLMTEAVFNADKWKLIKQDGVTVTAIIGSVSGEVLYKENPAPTITTIVPNSGSWKGGTAFTVTGHHLAASTVIKFDGVAATELVWVDQHTMNGKTPAHPSGAAAVDVTAV
jgi:hypothetical protein